MTREEIALSILCACIDPGRVMPTPSENEIRQCFRIAELFEKMSDEVGARPTRTKGMSLSRAMSFDDDEDD